MRATLITALAAALCLAVASTGLAALTCPPIDLTLDKHKVEMGMTYDGETIMVSGAAPAGSQVALLLVSRDNPPLMLSRKGKVGLFWMAVKQLEVRNLPFLYRIYTSGPLTSVAGPEAISQLGLGYDHLRGQMVAECVKGEPSADDAEVLFKGFLQLKEGEGLYGVSEGAVTVSPEGRFQQAVTLPDRAIEGTYLIHAYAFKDGRLVGSATRELVTQKVGLGKWLVTTSQHNGVLYGVMAVVVALGAGLGIGAIFKKGAAH
mgnify:CR=1 FL=1